LANIISSPDVRKERMNRTKTMQLVICMLILSIVVFLLDERFDKVLVVENLTSGKHRRNRKTYEEFVAAAKVDHMRVIGVPWVQLPDLDGYLPSYLKYRESLLTPIVDQGVCGSCWSISVVQMLADRVSVYTKGRVVKLLSVQEMISCWDGHDGKGCSEGGVPEMAYHYIIKNGVGLQKDYPYLQHKTNKLFPCDKSRLNGERLFVEPGSVRSLCIDPYKFKKGSAKYKKILDLNIKNMKKELLVNGPFVCTIMVYENLYSYDGLSVYEGSKGSDFVGGHSVVCVGYCDEGINGTEPGFDTPGGYWVIRNSWSDWPLESPASEGYFYIKKGSNVCGIESRASRAFPVLSARSRTMMVSSLDESRYTSYTDYVNDPDRKLLVTKVGRIRGWLTK
jgi:hypothetical protein